MYLASVVNLGMIWCFGFFFLELLDDFDEKSNNDDALASLDDADRKLGSDSDKRYIRYLCNTLLNICTCARMQV